MSQTTISVNKMKQLTFEEICPRWSNRLKTKNKDEDRHMTSLYLSDSRCCVVGEAHGLDDGYAVSRRGSYSKYCRECHLSSMRIYDSEIHELRVPEFKARGSQEYEIQEFVKHWNEVHVK